MMRLFSLLISILLIISCGSKNNNAAIQTFNNDSVTFFQANDFFAQQINTVKHAPYFIYKTFTQAGRTDSLSVSAGVFDTLASIFTRYNISNKEVKKYYKESAFNDESTHSITLSYSTMNKELPIQSMDVLLNQETQAVKRIFITLVENTADTAYLYKLSWKANENFSIMKSVTAGGKEETSQTTVVWK